MVAQQQHWNNLVDGRDEFQQSLMVGRLLTRLWWRTLWNEPQTWKGKRKRHKTTRTLNVEKSSKNLNPKKKIIYH